MESETPPIGNEPVKEPHVAVAHSLAEFERLDPLVVQFWTISAGLGASIPLLAALVGGGAIWIYTEFPWFVILLVWLWLGLNLFLQTAWLPRRRYDATSFRLAPTFFEFRSGVYWKTSVMIPISRLQHIDLLRGPLERRFGLATLEIYTAGTRNASHKIAGLQFDRALELRRRMIEAAELEAE